MQNILVFEHIRAPIVHLFLRFCAAVKDGLVESLGLPGLVGSSARA